MHDKLYKPLKVNPLRIERIWDVKADLRYNVNWIKPYPHDGYIILRTYGGEGLIGFRTGKEHVVFSQSILTFDANMVRFYRTFKPRWDFLWIEVSGVNIFKEWHNGVKTLPFLDNELLCVSNYLRGFAVDEFSDMKSQLGFLSLIIQWTESLRKDDEISDNHMQRLHDLVSLMSKTAKKPLKISELADRMCLSESRFRQIFHNEFGLSPKRYYKDLRMSTALQWLRGTDMKLSEIAERLSFSSQYHLSREFKKYFGTSPSNFRPRRAKKKKFFIDDSKD